MHYTSLLAVAVLQPLASAFDISFCKDNKCSDDCPVTLTTLGDGYPDCEVYGSESVFGNQGFDGSESGGYSVYMNVEEPESGCSTLLLTPAHVDEQGCGALAGSFKEAVCVKVDLEESFMVQYCCDEECEDAGGMRRRSTYNAGLGPRRSQVVSNGTVVEPMEVGTPKARRDASQTETTPASPPVMQKREIDNCDGDWKADDDADYYTTNSDERQVVYADYKGGQVTITSSRSQSYTEEMSAGLTFEAILSLGTSFSITEETSSSESVSFQTDDGQVGSVVFTPKLKCTKGKATCDGQEVSGTVCTGYKFDEDDPKSDLAGTYQVLLHS